MERVMVLMSTYNGEKYLDVQIRSILTQVGVQVNILIRDDGSTDNTLNILHDYAERFNNIKILEESNCGAIQSFYKLMAYAVNHYTEYKYFAFSDQDDYWYPEKLVRAVSCNITNNSYFFYHSCYEIVDENLNLLNKSNNNVMGTLGEALVANQAIGCSEVFTLGVLRASAQIYNYKLKDEKYYPYHDLWVYLVALATKADVYFDNKCTLKYRQHANNVIGTGRTKIQTLRSQLNNLHKTKNIKSNFARILSDILVLDDDVKELLYSVYNYKDSFYNSIKLIFRKELRVKERLLRLAFYYSVLFRLF